MLCQPSNHALPVAMASLTTLLIVSGIGCRAAPRGSAAATRNPLVIDGDVDSSRLWQAIQDTLRRHRYSLDRVDVQQGVVTTLPVVSQNFLEFWRHDVDTRRDLLESTLNPIRRWAKVTLQASDSGSENGSGNGHATALAVSVFKQRLSSLDRQFNSTGAAYQFFGDRLPSTTGLVRVGKEHDQWLDLGRDAAMESRLLRKILERATSPLSDE